MTGTVQIQGQEIEPLTKRLMRIQQGLKSPKCQYNKFGGYAYRSAADILLSAKPLLEQENAVVILSDDVFLIGDRYYIKSTAILKCSITGEEISVNGFAREDLQVKGCSGGQITGACSSYARKYALCGLLAIDDSKDLDDPGYYQRTQTQTQPQKGYHGQQPQQMNSSYQQGYQQPQQSGGYVYGR